AYLRLLSNRADDAAFERAVNTPPRGIGARTLEQVRARARDEGISLWDAVRREIDGTRLAARARHALRGFVELIQSLAQETVDLDLAPRIDHVLAASGLRAHYANESRGLMDARTDNLDELVTVASRFARSDDDATSDVLI